MSNVGQKRTVKRFALLLSVLCMACLLLLGAVVPRAAFAAEEGALGVKDSVFGWEIATQKNLQFSQDGDWARFEETTRSVSADTIDVIFNREGYDISQPIELKIKFNVMPTGDHWLGFFICKDLTTEQQNMLVEGKTTLDIDISGTESNPWARCRIAQKVVGTTAGTGNYISGSETGKGVDADGSFTMKIEVGDEQTVVTFSGNEHEMKYSIPKMTSAYFTNGKLYFNSRFHNSEEYAVGLYDVSLSAVKNGVPIHYTVGEETTTQKIAEGATTLTLPAAPDMPAGQTFGAWRAPDGKMYKAEETYTFADGAAKETTFTAVPSASDAVVSLEYETVVWNGEEKKPSVTVTLGDVTIDSSNYDVVYADNINVGKGKVTVTFKNEYYGSATAEFTIAAAAVTLEYDTVVWNGEEKKPSVTVTLGDVTIDSSNYDVAYVDNINVGTGKVTVTFKNEYYGSATAEFTITKIQENKTEEDVSLTLEDATFEKMKVLGGDYVYTIKDAAGNEVTAQTQIAAGLYIVTAVLDTETKTTTVTYRVAVGKTLEDAEGEDISLTFEEATYAKMTALGSDYVYTVTDSQGNTVTEGTALAAGVYTVKAVKETATQIRTVTYTVTIAQPVEVEDPSDDPTPPPEDPDENQGEDQGNGCSSSVGGGALAVFAVTALAVCAVLIARRKNNIRK